MQNSQRNFFSSAWETGGSEAAVAAPIEVWINFRLVIPASRLMRTEYRFLRFTARVEILPDQDMKWYTFIWMTASMSIGWNSAEAQIGNSAGGWTISSTSPVKIQFAGKHVATYNLGKEEGKPFFYPVYGPTGENMTRHYPQTDVREGEQDDHIHHRGMWYGLGNVNGLDFWHFPGTKKDKKFGRIVHKGVNQTRMSGDKITIGTKSDWVNDKTGELVCQDTRVFTFSHGSNGALVVDITIKLIASKGDVLIRDDKEGAWAIRVPATMRLEGAVAKGGITNSAGKMGKDAWGKRANWVHYFGPDEKGNPAGIAILDHPSNPRHPTWWHARHYGLFTANPFGQGNFEKETEKGAGDFTIRNGDSIAFRYRTIFHKGEKASLDCNAAFAAFSAQ